MACRRLCNAMQRVTTGGNTVGRPILLKGGREVLCVVWFNRGEILWDGSVSNTSLDAS